MLMSMAGCLELEPLPPIVDAALDGGRDARLTGDGGVPDADPPPDRGRMDVGPAMDAMLMVDAGPSMDAGPAMDAMLPIDAMLMDALPLMDAMPMDMGSRAVDVGVGCVVDEDCLMPDNSCMRRTCNADGVCVQQIRANGAECDDGQYCTVEDRCTRGTCVGQLRSCEPGVCMEEEQRCSGTCEADAECQVEGHGECQYANDCAERGSRILGQCLDGQCNNQREANGCARDTEMLPCGQGRQCRGGNCMDVEE